MDIYPQDLGAARRARMTRPTPRTPDRLPALALALVVVGLLLFHLGGAGGTIPLVLLIVFSSKLLLALACRWKEQTRAVGPLTPAQVQDLLARTRDPLEREFLGVALAAVSLPRIPEAAAETQVREAIRALGAAIEKLPPSPVPTQSAQKLAGRALSLADEAERETDPVVAATLHRRAETRQRQAQTMALIETLARRTAAMRQELSDQLDSLQTSLAAFRLAGVWSVQEMAEVAAGIQWVAIKANSLAAAQVDMDDALYAARLPNPHYNGPGGTRQRLQPYISDDTEV